MVEKGTQLQERYVILSLLGVGGESGTYLAQDKKMYRKVAIKQMSEKPGRDRLEAWSRLLQTGKLPGIAQLLDTFEDGGKFYLVQEYAEGRNCAEYLKERGRGFSTMQALRIMEPVIKGLSLLHENHLLHRDISTDNILITADGNGFLCDLGMVCELREDGAAERADRVKAGFSPLEMYREDGRQGTWSDAYEVCATMYHLMTGKILEVPALRNGRDIFADGIPQLPKQVEALLRAGLELKWEERLQNLSPFCQMLDSLKYEDSDDESVGFLQQPEDRAYIAPPQRRTMPVNIKGIMSVQPDNAMNGRQKNRQGAGGKILYAISLVCMVVTFLTVGFAYYQTHNADEEETADNTKEEADTGEDGSESSGETAKKEDISLDELIEKYGDYLRDNKITYVTGYRLIRINNDELPECFYINQYKTCCMLYYNKSTKVCEQLVCGGSKITYSEKGNIFCAMSGNFGDYQVSGRFFNLTDTGGGKEVGDFSKTSDSYRVGLRAGIHKEEFEEYVADFGELPESFTYYDMYVSLEKAYEKFLSE